MAVYRAREGDSWRGIAQRFLGDGGLAWTFGEATPAPLPGQAVIVPLTPRNPVGVDAEQYQTVTILCYHRFGSPASKMTITPQSFAAQLDWLARNGYRVIRLAELQGFLQARRPLPPRSVVITIDDGYESVHRHAFPLLKKHGFPATVFVYTDFIGVGDGMNWAQLQEMQRSGLVDVQSHSKSHRNLVERAANETDARYRQAIDNEMRVPRELLARRIEGSTIKHIAWPFGDANAVVLDSAARHGFELGATVAPGGNAFFAQPLLLKRTMIFGDLDLEGFKTRLQTSRAWAAPAPAGAALLDDPAPPDPRLAAERQLGQRAESAEAQGRLADALWARDALLLLRPGESSAERQAARLRQLRDQRINEAMQRGREAQRRNDAERAQRGFLAALALDPTHAAAADALRQLERERHERQQPGRFAREPLSGRPADATRAPAERNVSEHAAMLAAQGEVESAIVLLARTGESLRNDPALRRQLADLYLRRAQALGPERRAEALAALREALRLDPGNEAARQLQQQLGARGAPPT